MVRQSLLNKLAVCLAIALGVARRTLSEDTKLPLEALILLGAAPLFKNAVDPGTISSSWRGARSRSWCTPASAPAASTCRARALGVIVGFAISCKYTVAVYAPLLLIAVVTTERFVALEARKKVLYASVGIGAAVSMVVPWLLKNALHVGNPFFPFLVDVFGPKEVHRYGLGLAARQTGSLIGASGHGLFDLPWFFSMETRDSLQMIGPVFLMATPLALAGLVQPRPVRWRSFVSAALLVSGWVLYVAVFRNGRYGAPIMAATALGLSVAIQRAFAGLSGEGLRMVASGVVVVLFSWLPLRWSFEIHADDQPLAYHCGGHDARGYLSSGRSRRLPNYPGALHEAAEDLEPVEHQILFLGEHKTFGFSIPHVSASIYDRSVLVPYVRGAKSPEEVHERLRKVGFTHLAINAAEAYRLHRSYGVLRLKEDEQELWARFSNQFLEPLSHENNQFLLAIRDEPWPDARGPDIVGQVVAAVEAEKAR
ncbi:MAG: hypothetical protein HC923_03205 [Myxococcales bacterium]|nr:hypothetical protein [Myxococcales bacterium]